MISSAELTLRVEKVAGRPPLSELSREQLRELREALLGAGRLEELPGKWQAAILEAEAGPRRPRSDAGE